MLSFHLLRWVEHLYLDHKINYITRFLNKTFSAFSLDVSEYFVISNLKGFLKFLKFTTITTTQMWQLWHVKKVSSYFVFPILFIKFCVLFESLYFVSSFIKAFLVKTVFSNLLLKFCLPVFLKCFLFLPDLSLTFLKYLFLK